MELLRAENVVKRYAGHTALSGVSITVPEKSIYGLLGPNGAGKTSLIRIINQITGPDAGAVFFNGEKLAPAHLAYIGYLPEERGLYKKMKVGEQSIYLARLKGMSRTEAIQQLRNWFDRLEISSWWDKKIEDLSKGMAQKVQFITTVMHKPKLLILDEPFSGFDPINADIIKKEILRLRDEGSTIIFSTHNMGSVEEMCDEISLINQSKVILDGRVSDIRKRFRSHVYEIDFSGNMIAFANALWAGFELIDREQVDKTHFKAKVKLLHNNNLNALLGALIPHVEINGVRELIPSMNDIFIEVVNQQNQQHG
jgi:ABC-2 type transport system ATP-binding protein